MSNAQKMLNVIEEALEEYKKKFICPSKENDLESTIDELIELNGFMLRMDYIFVNSMEDKLCLTTSLYYQNTRTLLNDQVKNYTDMIPLLQDKVDPMDALGLLAKLTEGVNNCLKEISEE